MVAQYGKYLHSTVLLVPRHGADTAATPTFLQSVNPEVVVATGDKPVSPYVLARLGDIPLYSTMKHGNVVCVLDGKLSRLTPRVNEVAHPCMCRLVSQVCPLHELITK